MFLFHNIMHWYVHKDKIISSHQLITNHCGGIPFLVLADLLKGMFVVEGVVVSLLANVSSEDWDDVLGEYVVLGIDSSFPSYLMCIGKCFPWFGSFPAFALLCTQNIYM